jgi:hypothetical protein
MMGVMASPQHALKILLARTQEEILVLETRLQRTNDHADQMTLNNKLADLHAKRGDLKSFLAKQDQPN